MVTREDVFRFLREMEIREDDTVTIHASLRAVGEIEGGADGLIDAFTAYLSKGIFLVPTHTWASVKRKQPVFDVRTEEPCIGTLARVAAFRKDAYRTLHPTHSLAVFGEGREEYARGEENSTTPAPPGGCLARLYERRGKILLVGVGHERNTYLHAVDEMLNIPNRLNWETYIPRIVDHDGKVHEPGPYHTHRSEGMPCCCSEYYPNYKKAFEYFGAVTYGKLGNAVVYCCDAVRMTDVVRLLWEQATYDLCSLEKEVPEEYYIGKTL